MRRTNGLPTASGYAASPWRHPSPERRMLHPQARCSNGLPGCSCWLRRLAMATLWWGGGALLWAGFWPYSLSAPLCKYCRDSQARWPPPRVTQSNPSSAGCLCARVPSLLSEKTSAWHPHAPPRERGAFALISAQQQARNAGASASETCLPLDRA